MSLNPILLRAGGPSFLPHSTVLKAGPLSLLLEQGEVRRVKLGETEIIRRIYLAVRGSDWRTISPVLSDLKTEQDGAAFRASYTLTHRQAEFDFYWAVTVEGSPEGRISFRAEGKSASAFSTNRVGMCLLHPPKESAGRPVRWTGPDGTEKEGRFPGPISPHEPFKDILKFSHQLEGGAWVDLAYEGEVFEMEDQRNWTDGSFKTYCPPAHLPKPRKIEPGWETVQGVTLELRGVPAVVSGAGSGMSPGAVPAEISLRLDQSGKGLPLPALGLSSAAHGLPLGPKDLERLRALSPAHLRVNFRLADGGVGEALDRAAAESAALGAPLEAAVVVGEDVEGTLSAFAAEAAKRNLKVIRWLVFHQKSDSTPVAVFEAAVKHLRGLAPEAAFVLGSKNDFVLLNRGRPVLEHEPAVSAGMAYAMCPQVHAFDNRNVVESLEGQEWTLRTAKGLFPRNPLHISTVSLKRSPFAASLKLAGPPPADAWRQQADARQVSLFAAGWTLASVKRLALQGAASGTYYETTGPLGLLAGESLDEADRNFPGMDFRLDPSWAFPLYHVLADLAAFRGGEVIPVTASHPLRCEGLALRAGKRRALLVANLEETACRVKAQGLPPQVRLRRLDDGAARLAVEKPEEFRLAASAPLAAPGGVAELDLKPFELARLDWE